MGREGDRWSGCSSGSEVFHYSRILHSPLHYPHLLGFRARTARQCHFPLCSVASIYCKEATLVASVGPEVREITFAFHQLREMSKEGCLNRRVNPYFQAFCSVIHKRRSSAFLASCTTSEEEKKRCLDRFFTPASWR